MAFAYHPVWSFIHFFWVPFHTLSWGQQAYNHTNSTTTQNLQYTPILASQPSVFFSCPPKCPDILIQRWIVKNKRITNRQQSSRLKVIVRPLTRSRNIFFATSWRCDLGMDRWWLLVVVTTWWLWVMWYIYINGCEGIQWSECSRHMQKIWKDLHLKIYDSYCFCSFVFSIKRLLAFSDILGHPAKPSFGRPLPWYQRRRQTSGRGRANLLPRCLGYTSQGLVLCHSKPGVCGLGVVRHDRVKEGI